MYGCESWSIKNAECWRIGAFELWCWRRLLRVHWTAKGSNQLTLKEISLEYSLEGLMLKLKLQYFGHLMGRINWLIKKDSDSGKDWRREKRMTDDKMVGWHHRLDGQEFEQAPGDDEGQGGLVCCSPSISPRVYSNSCRLSWWCSLTILSFVTPSSFCLQSFQNLRFFQGVSSSHEVVKVLELQLQHQSFQWIFKTDFL